MPSLRAIHVCSPPGRYDRARPASRFTRAVNNRTWRLHVLLHLEMEYLGSKVMDRPRLIEPDVKQFDTACITALRQTDIPWLKVFELRSSNDRSQARPAITRVPGPSTFRATHQHQTRTSRPSRPQLAPSQKQEHRPSCRPASRRPCLPSRPSRPQRRS